MPMPTQQRAALHRAEHGRAGADDHQPLEAEMPDAGALGEHAGERHIDQRRARAEDGDERVFHQAALRRERKKPVSRFGQVRAVMKSAMAALMMSIAAAGSPASTGR